MTMAEDIKNLEELTDTGVTTFVAGYTNDPINPPTNSQEKELCDSTRVHAGWYVILDTRNPFAISHDSPLSYRCK